MAAVPIKMALWLHLNPLIPHSFASASLLANIMAAKFMDSLPL